MGRSLGKTQIHYHWIGLWIVLILSSLSLTAQEVDTVITNDAYSSYFSKKLELPLFVEYKLWRGGGECDRRKFRFKNDIDLEIADSEYSKSGYDRGHLANAEDFAYDCRLDELTFRYYNCLPQTPNLNRGAWRSWETKIRKISQQDSLLIVTGGHWVSGKIHNNMQIPDYCWKIVYSLSAKQTIIAIYCENLSQASCLELSERELEEKLGFNVLEELSVY